MMRRVYVLLAVLPLLWISASTTAQIDLAGHTETGDHTRGDEGHIFHLMAVWGRIAPNRDTRWTPLRWDPALQVMEGDGVRVRRELRFERGDRVHPQRVRSLDRIRSATGPSVDSVVARVVVADTDRSFLRFESLPFDLKIPARDLGRLNEFHPIDDAGNGIMLTALSRPPTSDPAASGFMAGRWAATHDSGGVLGGVWRATNGQRAGYIAGRWGATDAGDQVFHGKVVNNAGAFLAFMAGNYDKGAYRAEVYGRGGDLLGHVRGHYTGGDGGSEGRYLGVWRLRPAEPGSLTCEGACAAHAIAECNDDATCFEDVFPTCVENEC